MAITDYPLNDMTTAVRTFGEQLGRGEWQLGESLASYAGLIIDLGVADDYWARYGFRELEQADEAQVVGHDSEPFHQLTTMAVTAIVGRDPVANEQPVPTPFHDVIEGSHLEGVLYETESGKAFRKFVADTNGALLRSLVDGMADGGYPRHHAKALERQQIEVMLDQLSGRTGYGAIAYARSIHQIRSQAGLNNLRAHRNDVLRAGRQIREIGLSILG
ncbi:MAG: hypothetical protein JWM81_243 [Candidatus Saccharibacteria bacterium]|nr:hypothetical protein [Candidatus Saccharibacteria bacterium]